WSVPAALAATVLLTTTVSLMVIEREGEIVTRAPSLPAESKPATPSPQRKAPGARFDYYREAPAQKAGNRARANEMEQARRETAQPRAPIGEQAAPQPLAAPPALAEKAAQPASQAETASAPLQDRLANSIPGISGGSVRPAEPSSETA